MADQQAKKERITESEHALARYVADAPSEKGNVRAQDEEDMIRKITGLFLVLASAVVLWLFPAFVTPRHGPPYEGQDLMQFHETEMAKHNRSERITLLVCVPAGVVLGIGLSLMVSGMRKTRRPEPASGG